MVASTMDSKIHVADNFNDPLAKFSLYQLPGQGNKPKGFLLVPQAQPGFAVSIVHEYTCDQLTDNETAELKPKVQNETDRSKLISGKNCHHFWNTQTQAMSPTWKAHPSVRDAAVHLAKAPVSEKNGMAITIRGSGDHVNNYMFVHAGSWKVENRADNPELGGYWLPEPSLPLELTDFDGPPCEHACESLSAPSAMVGVCLMLALAVVSFS